MEKAQQAQSPNFQSPAQARESMGKLLALRAQAIAGMPRLDGAVAWAKRRAWVQRCIALIPMIGGVAAVQGAMNPDSILDGFPGWLCLGLNAGCFLHALIPAERTLHETRELHARALEMIGQIDDELQKLKGCTQ